MAFVANCVIYKSNPTLWRKLSEMGLKRNPFEATQRESTPTAPRCIVVQGGMYYDVAVNSESLQDFIDCGTDENFFLALAALRNDTDQNQVFIYDDRAWNNDNPRRFWFKCRTPDVADDMHQSGMHRSCTKATIAELIYHFQGMDDDMCCDNEVKPTTQY